MRLWLNVNKDFRVCSGVKHLIGIWVRLFDPPSLKEMGGEYLFVLRDQFPIPFPIPRNPGSLGCTMSRPSQEAFFF